MECTKANGCFSAWPPVTVKGKPTMSGVKGKLGTFKNSGVTQVTLNGHPLYTFAGDHGVGRRQRQRPQELRRHLARRR